MVALKATLGYSMAQQCRSELKTCLFVCHVMISTRELVHVAAEKSKIGLRMNGYVTNANYSMKKCQFLLFINSECLVWFLVSSLFINLVWSRSIG